MNNYRKAGFVIVGILLVVLYFFNRKDLELDQTAPVILHNISASGGALEANIKLKNPNLLSSTIKTIHETFSVNGVVLGILDNQLNQGIPGLKETSFPASIRFSHADLARALGSDTANPNGATLTVEGDIAFQNLFTSGNIKVHQSAPVTTQY